MQGLVLAGLLALVAALALPAFASASAASDLQVSTTATPTMDRQFNWSILKTVDGAATKTAAAGSTVGFDYTVAVTKSAPVDSNWKVTGTISVTNPNTFAVTGTVADDIVGSTADTCTITGGASRSFAAGQTTQLAYSCTFSSKPAYSALTNSASVTWLKNSVSATNSGSTPFQFASGSAGNPALTSNSIHVVDVFNNSPNPVVLGDPTASTSYSVHEDVTVPNAGCTDFTNVASFTPLNAGGYYPNTSSVVTHACVSPHDLTIAKTANPSFVRSYDWTVAKSVDQSSVTTTSDTATFTYTVVATKGAPVDSAWKVTGAISVTNPNSYGVTNVVVTDQGVDNGGTCTLDSTGTIGSMTPNQTVSVPYTCTYAAAPSPAAGTNTAHVTWTVPASGNVPASNGSGSVSQSFAFGAPTTVVHDAVNVGDAFNGAALATFDGGTAISSSKTFTYSRTVAVPATACLTYPNTAVITATDDSTYTKNASVTVQVCRQAPPTTPSTPTTPTTPTTPPTAASTPVTPVTPKTPTKKVHKASTKVSKTTITLSKRASASTVKAGGTVDYTVVWKNTGKASAKNVVICDDLPNQMTFVSAKGASFKNGKACWTRTSVAKGATLTFRVVAHVSATVGNGQLVNVATATASNAKPATAKAPVRALRNARVRAGGVTG